MTRILSLLLFAPIVFCSCSTTPGAAMPTASDALQGLLADAAYQALVLPRSDLMPGTVVSLRSRSANPEIIVDSAQMKLSPAEPADASFVKDWTVVSKVDAGLELLTALGAELGSLTHPQAAAGAREGSIMRMQFGTARIYTASHTAICTAYDRLDTSHKALCARLGAEVVSEAIVVDGVTVSMFDHSGHELSASAELGLAGLSASSNATEARALTIGCQRPVVIAYRTMAPGACVAEASEPAPPETLVVSLGAGPPASKSGDGEMDTGDSWVFVTLDYAIALNDAATGVDISAKLVAQEFEKGGKRAKDSRFTLTGRQSAVVDGQRRIALRGPTSGRLEYWIKRQTLGQFEFDSDGVCTARARCDAKGRSDHQVTTFQATFKVDYVRL